MPRHEGRRGSSKLLIAEPPLLVLPSLAVAVGLNEAIFLQQLHYWMLRSEHHHDGRWWIYNTYEEWHVQLPFWSVRTIRRIVGELKERELILTTTKYNRQKVDQTLWYSLDYDVLDRLPETADQVDNLTTWAGQTEQVEVDNLAASVPETTTENSPERRVPKTREEIIQWEEERERRRRFIKALDQQ